MNLILEAYYDNPKSSLDLIPIMFQRMTHIVIPFRSNHDLIPNRNSHKSPIYGLKGERISYDGSFGLMNMNIFLPHYFHEKFLLPQCSAFLKKIFFLNKNLFFLLGLLALLFWSTDINQSAWF